MTEFPNEALEAGLTSPWRSAAVGLYQKWAGFLVARKAEQRAAQHAPPSATPYLARLAAELAATRRQLVLR